MYDLDVYENKQIQVLFFQHAARTIVLLQLMVLFSYKHVLYQGKGPSLA